MNIYHLAVSTVASWKEGLFHQLNLYLVSSPQACNNNNNNNNNMFCKDV